MFQWNQQTESNSQEKRTVLPKMLPLGSLEISRLVSFLPTSLRASIGWFLNRCLLHLWEKKEKQEAHLSQQECQVWPTALPYIVPIWAITGRQRLANIWLERHLPARMMDSMRVIQQELGARPISLPEMCEFFPTKNKLVSAHGWLPQISTLQFWKQGAQCYSLILQWKKKKCKRQHKYPTAQ